MTKRPFIAWCACLFGLTLLAYLPALQGGLLMDDAEHITRPELRSLAGLARIWFEPGATAQYYPLLNTAFWLEYRLWGDAVLGYHLANVFQHALAACLLVAIARRLQLPGALLAGLIFALHPVCVESVAWISEQKNTLSAVFYLAAAFVYLGYDRERTASRYALASALFVVALAAKTVTATLPAALLVVFWWKRGRLEWRRDIAPLLPWFALGIGSGVFTAWFEQRYSGAHGPDFEQTFLERCLIAGRALWFYACSLFWPADLMFINPRWTPDVTIGWHYLYPAGALALAGTLAAMARRNRGPLAALLLFAGTLFPALGFVNVNWFIFSFVADHFQYLACIGVIAPVAAVLTIGAKRLASPFVAQASAALLVAVLAGLTWRQSSLYRDAETLYRDIVARNPTAWLAHNNLGTILEEKPDGLPQALAHYRRAIELKPDHARAYSNLGKALLKTGDTAGAIAAFETSLELQSASAEVRVNYANALARIPDRLPQAVAEYRRALDTAPGYALGHYNLGRALATLGRPAEAMAAYRRALQLAPDHADAHNSLGNLLADDPLRIDEAMAAYRRALQLNPQHAEIRRNLALLLASLPGREAEAAAELEHVLRLAPDDHETRYQLGALLATQPARLADAASHFETLVRALPDSAATHNALGSVLARLPGRTQDAIRHLEHALQLNPTFVEAHYNLGRLLAEQPERRAEAIAHFEEALKLRPDLEAARDLIERLRRR